MRPSFIFNKKTAHLVSRGIRSHDLSFPNPTRGRFDHDIFIGKKGHLKPQANPRIASYNASAEKLTRPRVAWCVLKTKILLLLLRNAVARVEVVNIEVVGLAHVVVK
jgi:hypothetical protein